MRRTEPHRKESAETMKPTSTFDFVQHCVKRLGWAVAEVKPGLKHPTREDWGLLGQHPERWRLSPNLGICLIHNLSRTCAFDQDAPAEWIAQALAAADIDYAALVDTPGPRIVGNPSNPAKQLFRVPDGVLLSPKKLTWRKDGQDITIFELRSNVPSRQSQDVLPPTIHPKTGAPYAWAGTGMPQNMADVPELPADLLELWIEWSERLPLMVAACPWGDQPPVPTRTPTQRQAPRDSAATQVSDLFNAHTPIGLILERNGYDPIRTYGGKSPSRWKAPDSNSGAFGVALQDDNRIYSHHASSSDPLADGYTHSAFDVLCILQHDGDAKAAARAAADELREAGIDVPDMRRQRAKARAAEDARIAAKVREQNPHLRGRIIRPRRSFKRLV